MRKTGVVFFWGWFWTKISCQVAKKWSLGWFYSGIILAIVEFMKSTMETWAPKWLRQAHYHNFTERHSDYISETTCETRLRNRSTSDMRMSHTHLHHSILHAADHDSSVICYCRTIVYIHHTSIIYYVCTNLLQYDRERLSLSLSLYIYASKIHTAMYKYIYIYIYIYPRCYI